MFNSTWLNQTSTPTPELSPSESKLLNWVENHQAVVIGLTSAFLVSVPVFIQAPLVRYLPYFSLFLTAGWLGLSWALLQRPRTQIWGDLLFGFSWSWLAGSIYWGWLRWEPLVHLPIEAIGLPFALWGLYRGYLRVGNLFYLGSLLGTAITDIYFYLTGLIPYWRELMSVEPDLVAPIFKSAIAQVESPWGITCAIILLATLLTIGISSLKKPQPEWWGFGGAVLSTILVDGLFWVAASFS